MEGQGIVSKANPYERIRKVRDALDCVERSVIDLETELDQVPLHLASAALRVAQRHLRYALDSAAEHEEEKGK